MREENNDGNIGPGEADKYFRLIAENMTDMITLVDTTGRRLYRTPNNSFLGGFGEMTGRDSFQDVHTDDRERIKSIFLIPCAQAAAKTPVTALC